MNFEYNINEDFEYPKEFKLFVTFELEDIDLTLPEIDIKYKQKNDKIDIKVIERKKMKKDDSNSLF